MVKRVLAALAIGASVSIGFVAPAAAEEFTYAPLVPGGNVVEACRNSGNVVTFGIGGEVFDALETGSLGACVSTLRGNRLSTAAYFNNCRSLEPVFALENPNGKPYPYSFYGNPNYTARHIGDCIFFLRSFHTGALPPGPG